MKYQAILDELHAEVQSLYGRGKVADYIPVLAQIDGHKLGIAIETVDGQSFRVGDACEPFSIQSIAKGHSTKRTV